MTQLIEPTPEIGSEERFYSSFQELQTANKKLSQSLDQVLPYDPDDPDLDDLNEVQIPEVLQNSSDLLRHIDELGFVATKIQRKLLQGTLLDEFEFYIQRLFSLVPWVIEDFVKVGEYSEYERYCLMHYDDARQCGLIDTQMHERCLHHAGGRLMSLRRVPVQDVFVTELSEDQIQFFEQHFPVEFSKFG